MLDLKCHFDGKNLVPEEPVSLPINTSITVHIDENPLVQKPRRKRVLGSMRGSAQMSADFNDPLPDDFWFGKSK